MPLQLIHAQWYKSLLGLNLILIIFSSLILPPGLHLNENESHYNLIIIL